jgi:hypothetical protein
VNPPHAAAVGQLFEAPVQDDLPAALGGDADFDVAPAGRLAARDGEGLERGLLAANRAA